MRLDSKGGNNCREMLGVGEGETGLLICSQRRGGGMKWSGKRLPIHAIQNCLKIAKNCTSERLNVSEAFPGGNFF